MKTSIAKAAEKICIGVITSASGVRGRVKIKSFTESPLDIANFNQIVDSSSRSYNVRVVSSKKDCVIAGIEGVTNRNDAESLRNTKLYILRNELPGLDNDEFYHADLAGLEVRNTSGVTIGFVKNILNFGAGDILEITDLANDKTTYHPFNKSFVPEINIESGFLVVTPLEEVIASPSEEL